VFVVVVSLTVLDTILLVTGPVVKVPLSVGVVVVLPPIRSVVVATSLAVGNVASAVVAVVVELW
jgi:hypothetical protein